MRLLVDEEADKMVNEDDVRREALEAVEQTGIVFIGKVIKSVAVNQGNQAKSRVRVCSVIYCPWSKARRYRPNTVW